MSHQKTIAVGSKNPVKIESALSGFKTMMPEFKFIADGYPVASGVSDQPMTCEETLTGATNRAERLKQTAPNVDFYVGIEGGIETIAETMFANAWIVIMSSDGQIGRGRSGSFALPPKVQKLVESGIELGYANDQVFGQQNSKHAGGAVGSLTSGIISRQSLYEHAMILSLIALRQPELFAT